MIALLAVDRTPSDTLGQGQQVVSEESVRSVSRSLRSVSLTALSPHLYLVMQILERGLPIER